MSVVIQVFALPVLGGLADRGGRKRALLGYSAYIGALATAGLFFVRGPDYLLGGALFVVANIAFGATNVLGNAFLPDIAGPADRDRVSSTGYAWGYAGGGLLLVLHLVLYSAHASFGLSKARRSGSHSARPGSGGWSSWCRRCAGCRPALGGTEGGARRRHRSR